MRKIFLYIAVLSLFAGTFYSCRTAQYLQQDERLYTGGEIKIREAESAKYKKELLKDLEEVNKPKPNEKIAGMRLGLWAHQKVENDKAGFYAKWVNNKIGEQPVLLGKVNTNNVQKLMRNRLENLGYFNSSIEYQINENKKTGHIEYVITPNNRLHIQTVNFQKVGEQKVDSLIQYYLDRRNPIQNGSPFSLDKIGRAHV